MNAANYNSSNHVVRQRGVVLLFGLVVMVALAVAALAIVRSVTTGTQVMGAIAFKNDATAAAAAGAEAAVKWIQANAGGSGLDSDRANVGYYASSMDALDATGNVSDSSAPLRIVKWGGRCESASGAYLNCNTFPSEPIIVNGNQVQWVITRLCAGPGSPGGSNPCAMPPKATVNHVNDRSEVTGNNRFKDVTGTPYFRIIVRAEGPRNTVSTIEQLVHF